MNKLYHILIIAFGLPAFSFCQDPQYSQFYAAKTYLNPGFAGTGNIQSRAVMNYRNQWPSFPNAFVSYNFSLDHKFQEINSGVGILFTHDKAGEGGLRFNTVKFQYSYEFQVSKDIFVRPGVEIGFASGNIDISKLTFGDELLRDAPTIEHSRGNVSYVDPSGGVIAYNERSWLGVSGHHLNEANIALSSGDGNLPTKLSVHGGHRLKLPIKKKSTSEDGRGDKIYHELILAANYKLQGKWDQFDIGAYYETFPLLFGTWYRGLPGIKSNNSNIINQDALIFMVGYTPIKNLNFAYSYDLTISKLASNTGGSHEVSLIFNFKSYEKPPISSQKRVPCPKF
ncbi:MAG: PorP/SprF family type IX secretion system membrane protein [Flavobacteriales bacterium]